MRGKDAFVKTVLSEARQWMTTAHIDMFDDAERN